MMYRTVCSVHYNCKPIYYNAIIYTNDMYYSVYTVLTYLYTIMH